MIFGNAEGIFLPNRASHMHTHTHTCTHTILSPKLGVGVGGGDKDVVCLVMVWYVMSDASLVGFVFISLFSIFLLWHNVLALCVVGVDRRATTGGQVEEGRDPEETGLLPVHTDQV